MSLNADQKNDLISAYVDHIIDGMDWGDLMSFVSDTLFERLEQYSDEALIAEVDGYYPHLLENDNGN